MTAEGRLDSRLFLKVQKERNSQIIVLVFFFIIIAMLRLYFLTNFGTILKHASFYLFLCQLTYIRVFAFLCFITKSYFKPIDVRRKITKEKRKNKN